MAVQQTQTFSDLYQSADWKTEKHVPVIEAPDSARAGEFFRVSATIGKEVAHPNKTDHHIQWIALHFLPDGAPYPFEIGRTELTAHGASIAGPDTSGVYTHHEMSVSFKADASGVLYASASCNIHGLWQSSRRIQVL